MLVQPHKRATADKEDVACVDLDELAPWVFASALLWDVDHSALQHLEQRLLDALPAYVASDTHVFALFCDLVNLQEMHEGLHNSNLLRDIVHSQCKTGAQHAPYVTHA